MRLSPSPAVSTPLDRISFSHVAAGVAAALLPVLPGFPLWLSILLLGLTAFGTWLGLRRLTLPAPLRLLLTLGMALAAVFGSGLGMSQQTGAALLAAMLASKLLETRSVRDGRSASSFALFSIMAGFLHDQGPLTLLLALLAAIILMTTLQRLARVHVPGPLPALPRPGPALAASVRLLAVSLPFAFAAFFLFPRFPNPLWGAPAPDNQARSGLSSEMSPGDIAQMLLDDSPALRVTFEGTPPPPQAMYWRGPVLSDFDGRRWSRRSSDTFSPAAPLRHQGAVLYHEVMLEPDSAPGLDLIGLDVPLEIPQDTHLNAQRSLLAQRPSSQVRRYRLGSALEHVFQAELSDMNRQRNLRLPQGYNPRTATLMASWQATDPAPEALIRRALELFHQEFSYTLTPAPLARDSVDDFLFGTRAGYCEHFASAFVVMMRQAGIPARVVTGYQGGTHNRIGDYWLIRNSDAHAWSEVWLEGRGWVRVDPTSAVAPERIQQGLGGIVPVAEGVWHWGQPLWDMADALRRGWNFVIVEFDAERQRRLLSRLGLNISDWRQIGLALLLGIALAIGLSFALLWRGATRPASDRLLVAWQGFSARLARIGIEKQRGETALAFARRAAQALPEHADAILALTQGYIMQRYAQAGPDAHATALLIKQLRRFRPRSAASRRSS